MTSSIEQDPWHRAWKLISKKKTYMPAKDLVKDNGTFTNSKEETNAYLLNKYFPENNSDRRREIRADMTNFANLHEPDICDVEIVEVIKNLKRRKAVSDKIPNEAMRAIHEALENRYWSSSSSVGGTWCSRGCGKQLP